MKTAYVTRKEFVADLNLMRRSQTSWYEFVGTVEGHAIRLKSFGTWNPRYEYDGLVCGGMHSLNVTGWKNEILDPFPKETA